MYTHTYIHLYIYYPVDRCLGVFRMDPVSAVPDGLHTTHLRFHMETLTIYKLGFNQRKHL